MSRSSGRPFTAAEQPPGTTRTLLRETDGGSTTSLVRRTVLPGGLRVVTEAMPGVRSAALGAWIGVGSRDETPGLAGASHYLEHLLFKGTRTRSALEISESLDAVGGELNAFTGKEYTCYHARVLDTDLPLAIDVVTDMVADSLIASADVEAERDVILEEIAMNDDDPDDAVHNLFAEHIWSRSPLGRPISGSVDSVKSLTREQINGYYRRRYRPENIVFAAAGNIEHGAVVRMVRRAFKRSTAVPDPQARPSGPRIGGRAPRPGVGAQVRHRTTEQANLVLGVPGVARTDRRRYVLGVLNAALGGGTSSRLFQEVREKRGLAYSIYSYAANYADTGMVGVYAGCSPRRIDDVLSICRDQIAIVARDGITAPELERGKGQLRGGTVLGLEDSGSRMSRIAKAELSYGELPSVSEVLRRIDAVTLDDVRDLAAELLEARPSLAVVGPFDDPSRFDRLVS